LKLIALAAVAALWVNATVTASGLRIRGAPSSNAPVLGKLAKGEKVEMLGEPNGGWCKVRSSRTTGYVACALIEPNDVAEESGSGGEGSYGGADGFGDSDDYGDGGAGGWEPTNNEERSVPEEDETPQDPRRQGGFHFAFALGIAQGNFALAGASEEEAAVGSTVRLGLGGVFNSGWLLGATLQQVVYEYEYALQAGALPETLKISLQTLTLDVGKFWPVGKAELGVRLFLGVSGADLEGRRPSESEDGEAFGVGVSLTRFVSDSVALGLEFDLRSYGITLQGMDGDGVETVSIALAVHVR